MDAKRDPHQNQLLSHNYKTLRKTRGGVIVQSVFTGDIQTSREIRMISLNTKRRMFQLEEKLEKLLNHIASPKLQFWNDGFQAAVEAAQKQLRAEVDPESSAAT